jgi:acetylornithine deacetylase/succinyl-diaminopimelate desuccinylase family protein
MRSLKVTQKPIIDPVELARELVSIPSVNPAGQKKGQFTLGEAQLTDFLESYLKKFGFSTLRQQVSPGRENLLARLDGDPDGCEDQKIVLFDAHQDTVSVEGMEIDPFDPVIRDGKLYGRGSCDTKGSMAAMIAAAVRLSQRPVAGMPTVVLSFGVNEEAGFTGIRKVSDAWDAEESSQFLPHKPDLAIVGEPTDLDVIIAHKGAIRWRMETTGVAAHSSMPEAGDNAIYKMAQVVQILQRYHQQAACEVPSHRLSGGATLNVGLITGGVANNIVPDRCVIEVDRRVPPGESTEAAWQHVRDYVEKQLPEGLKVEHEIPPLSELPSLTDGRNKALAGSLLKIVRQITGHGAEVGVKFGTHAGVLDQWEIPAVVFGPGSIEQAHKRVEWVEVEQIRQAADILFRLVESMANTK